MILDKPVKVDSPTVRQIKKEVKSKMECLWWNKDIEARRKEIANDFQELRSKVTCELRIKKFCETI